MEYIVPITHDTDNSYSTAKLVIKEYPENVEIKISDSERVVTVAKNDLIKILKSFD